MPLNPEAAAIACWVVWFEPPADALEDPVRFMAYAMRHATPHSANPVGASVDNSLLRSTLHRTTTKPAEWQDSEARHRFAEVVRAATSSLPQFVRRRDGREQVIMSKAYFEPTKPALKDVLLQQPLDAPNGAIEVALKEARTVVRQMLEPQESALTEWLADDSRHRPSKPTESDG